MKTIKLLVGIVCVTLCMSCSSGGNSLVDNEMKLIPITQGKKWGFINQKGEYVINPQFSEVGYFSEGVAPYFISNFPDIKSGFIDEEGKRLLNDEYEDVTAFSEGCAWVVKEEDSPELIDKTGKVLLKYKKGRDVYSFQEGLAIIKGDGDKYWAIDKKGNTVFELPKGYSFKSEFFEGFAVVEDDKGNRGYVNNNGKVVINCQFELAEPFVGGKAVVRSNGQYGVINTKGKYVINPQFQFMMADGDIYLIQMGDAYGWCDDKGKIIINPQFKRAMPFFHADLAPACLDDKFGFIDRKGKYVVNPQFDFADSFYGETAPVEVNGKWGLVDGKGEYVAVPQFDEMKGRQHVGDPTQRYLISRYFNIENIVEFLSSLFDGDKLDGMKISETSIDSFRKKYGLEYGEEVDFDFSRDMSYKFIAYGTFFQEVSDGWWGTETKYLPDAKLDYILLCIYPRIESKTDEIMEGLTNALQIKDGRTASGMYIKLEKYEGPKVDYLPLRLRVSDKPIKD